MLKGLGSRVAATRAVLVAIICAAFCLLGCASKGAPESAVKTKLLTDQPTADAEFRGMWVATAYNLDWPPQKYLDPSRLTDEIRAIVGRAKELNMNVIMLEVRAFDDRMYRGTDFPAEVWAKSLWDGNDPDAHATIPKYDPLHEWIQECHRQGIELYAWINPFRVRGPHIPYMPAEPYLAVNGEWYMHPEDINVQNYVLAVTKELLERPKLPRRTTVQATTHPMMLSELQPEPPASQPGGKGDEDGVDGIVVDHNYPPPPEAPPPPGAAKDLQGQAITAADKRTTVTYKRMFPSTGNLVDDFVHELYGLADNKGVRLGFSPLVDDTKTQDWMRNGWMHFAIPEHYLDADVVDSNGNKKDVFTPKFQKNWVDKNTYSGTDHAPPLVIAGLNTAMVQSHGVDKKKKLRDLEEVHKQIKRARLVTSTQNGSSDKDKVTGQAMYSFTAMRAPGAGGPDASHNIGDDLIAEPDPAMGKGLYAQPTRLPQYIDDGTVTETPKVTLDPTTNQINWSLPNNNAGVKYWEVWESSDGQTWGKMRRVWVTETGESRVTPAGTKLQGVAVRAIHGNGAESTTAGIWPPP